MFGGNFAPRGWALCDGQLLPISQNSALFSILGTTFGGDGRSNFGLPDLRGRVSIHPGNGPGLSTYRLGQKGGFENVQLSGNQIPSHNHLMQGNSGQPDESDPEDGFPANSAATGQDLYNSATNVVMGVTTNSGGGQAHTNIQPFQCVNYIIALEGVFPSRN